MLLGEARPWSFAGVEPSGNVNHQRDIIKHFSIPQDSCRTCSHTSRGVSRKDANGRAQYHFIIPTVPRYARCCDSSIPSTIVWIKHQAARHCRYINSWTMICGRVRPSNLNGVLPPRLLVGTWVVLARSSPLECPNTHSTDHPSSRRCRTTARKSPSSL